MTRPQLYPNHQHQWVSVTCGGVHEFGEDCNHESTLVRCTVCGFEAPRNLAGLDGQPDVGEPFVAEVGNASTTKATSATTNPPHPAQETRADD